MNSDIIEAITQIAREKRIDKETAWKLQKDREERERIAEWRIQKDIEEIDKKEGIIEKSDTPNIPNTPNTTNIPNIPNTARYLFFFSVLVGY